ncbi:MAG: GNAT family N-acetyltransferase, partial [Ilumatobacter sp.]
SERLRASGSQRLVMRTHRPSTSTAAASILSARGFTVARYFTDMHRSTTEPPTVDLPDGYEIATWDNERAEELRELKNLAFSDHWGSTPTSVESWDETISSSPTRLDLSRTVSTANGEIVGLLLTRRHPSDDEILGAPYAWMDLIATHPAHRGRGIAAAMIADALRAYREEGISRAALEVDADSPTGADRLYVGLGFEPWRATETDEMEVEPLTGPDGATSPPSA